MTFPPFRFAFCTMGVTPDQYVGESIEQSYSRLIGAPNGTAVLIEHCIVATQNAAGTIIARCSCGHRIDVAPEGFSDAAEWHFDDVNPWRAREHAVEPVDPLDPTTCLCLNDDHGVRAIADPDCPIHKGAHL